jgi:DivIVA domain-containing protein
MSLLDSITAGPEPDPSETVPLPQFDTVMRGYDRGQVDDYLVRLSAALREAQLQAEEAESALRQARDTSQHPPPGQPYEGLGERVQGMLQLAAEEAEAIRSQAQTEADAMVEEARDRREREVRHAEEELAEVAARREAVVTELCKVQDALAALGLQQPADVDGMVHSASTAEGGPSRAAAEGNEATDAAFDDVDATTVVLPPDEVA